MTWPWSSPTGSRMRCWWVAWAVRSSQLRRASRRARCWHLRAARDGLGTTHHEAGTLAMGDDPNTSVTDANARFHRVPNLYAAGPALFPTVGSPNPMLTGTALARRLADHLTAPSVPAPTRASPRCSTAPRCSGWQMSTIRNQPGRDDPGHFVVTNGALVAVPGTDIGLLWHTAAHPAELRAQARVAALAGRSQLWRVRALSRTLRAGTMTIRHLSAVDFGFEVQIDQLGQLRMVSPIHKTAAIYGFQGPANPNAFPVLPGRRVERLRDPGARAELYRDAERRAGHGRSPSCPVRIALHPDRGLPSTNAVPRFIGLQTHTGRVAFRHIQIRAL